MNKNNVMTAVNMAVLMGDEMFPPSTKGLQGLMAAEMENYYQESTST